MDVETAVDPNPQPMTDDEVAADSTTATTASSRASGSNPDGTGTPVTGGWPPPAK